VVLPPRAWAWRASQEPLGAPLRAPSSEPPSSEPPSPEPRAPEPPSPAHGASSLRCPGAEVSVIASQGPALRMSGRLCDCGDVVAPAIDAV